MTVTGPRRNALVRLIEAGAAARVAPPTLLDAEPFFDLAGEEFGRRLFLTTGNTGHDYCLRPDFTLPIAQSYRAGDAFGEPAAFSYLGPVYRQGDRGPEEYEQAGIELIGQPDADAALDQVFAFARDTLGLFGIDAPLVRLGGIALFEAILAGADMPETWRSRVRARFGHPDAMERLLTRLGQPAPAAEVAPEPREALVERVAEMMVAGGLNLGGSRLPDEIADRYLEQQALDAARVPARALDLLRAYLSISGPPSQALERAEALAREHGIELARPAAILRSHVESLAALLPKATIIYDAAFSPRLDYYTGVVFEMTGRSGAVLASGGQYDRLLERLGAGGMIAASGCAVWIDRLEEEVS